MSHLSWKGCLDQGLSGCEALGPQGHGVMRPALLCFSGKEGGVITDSGWSPLFLRVPVTAVHLFFPLLPHTQPVSGINLWLSHSAAMEVFICCLVWPSLARLLSLVAGNAHPLVCPNREVSLPEQTSP